MNQNPLCMFPAVLMWIFCSGTPTHLTIFCLPKYQQTRHTEEISTISFTGQLLAITENKCCQSRIKVKRQHITCLFPLDLYNLYVIQLTLGHTQVLPFLASLKGNSEVYRTAWNSWKCPVALLLYKVHRFCALGLAFSESFSYPYFLFIPGQDSWIAWVCLRKAQSSCPHFL